MTKAKKLISFFIIILLCNYTVSFADNELNSNTRSIPMPEAGNTFEWTASTEDNPLGGASEFNGFILGDFNSGIDVEGSLAVGGSLKTDNFSVNLHGEVTDEVSLLVGGNITANQGAVKGATVAGTEEGNNYNLSNITVSNVTTQGEYNVIDSTEYFEEARKDLTSRSESIASQEATGLVSHNGHGSYNLSGGDEDIVIFELTDTEIKNFSFNLDLKDGQKAIINVTGTEMTFDSGSMSINGNNNDKYLRENADRILFNASNATTINLQNAALYGDFLAPNASLNGSAANIAGTTVVNNYTGTQGFELHLPTTPTPTPTPGTTVTPTPAPTPTPGTTVTPTPTPTPTPGTTVTPTPTLAPTPGTTVTPTPTPTPTSGATVTPTPTPTPTSGATNTPIPTRIPELPATDGPADGILQFVGFLMIVIACFMTIVKYRLNVK